MLSSTAEELVRKVLRESLGITQKDVSSTPTTVYGHGPGGLFSAPGMSQPLFSAMILPQSGLQSVLPVYPSQDANPLFGIITGVTATTGSEPEGVCDDPPTVGLTKLCMHTFVFGRQSRQTRVFDVDRVGVLTNRGEFTDYRMIGNPFNRGAGVNVPTMPGANPSQVAQNELAKNLFEFGVGWSRDFAKELYTGNPTNNSAQGGRKYFYGLDILINTGYRDAETGIACPAADSIVRSFGSLDVATNGGTAVRQITNMYRNLKDLAARAGLAPVELALTMRWGLFYELTEIWPCAYLSYRCALPDGSTNFISAEGQTAMRDAMRGNLDDRTGQYLLIDGMKVKVIIDDAITETVLPGESFTSTIYFVPLSVMGNIPTLYMEHLKYDIANGAQDFANAVAPAGSYFATDDGRFFWHRKPPTNFCVQMLAKTEPRLLLLTPYLAARLTNVKYTPLAHERDPFTDSSFFVNGGSTSRNGYGPSFYSPTA